jgi:heme oxygenase
MLPSLQSETPPTEPTFGAVPILAAIRDATRSAHERIEAAPAMLRLMSADYTPAEYGRHLSRLLGFYEPLEAALAHAGTDVQTSLYANRSRLLCLDLNEFGLTLAQVDALPRCGDLPLLDAGNLLGGRYVCEGASLGGQIIARRLRQSLGTARGFAFYHDDAGLTGRNWKAFCAYLETRADVSVEAVCASALAVFEALGRWFEGQPIDAA